MMKDPIISRLEGGGIQLHCRSLETQENSRSISASDQKDSGETARKHKDSEKVHTWQNAKRSTSPDFLIWIQTQVLTRKEKNQD